MAAFRRRPARRLRHADRRARRQPLRRPAAARCARARARLGARVIVLDDPMSAVDTQTERPSRRAPPPRARRPHGADRDAAPLDRRGRRPRRRARRRRDRRVGHAGELLARGGLFWSLFGEEVGASGLGRTHRACRARQDLRRRSRCRARRRRHLRRRRAGRGAADRRRTRSTTASSARDHARPRPRRRDLPRHQRRRLGILQTTLDPRARRVGQDVVLGLRQRPLRPPDDAVAPLLLQQKAGWIISRLTSRRRRALRRALTGPDDARRQHAHALPPRSSRLFIARLAARLVALVILPPTLSCSALVPGALACGVPARRETIAAMTAQIAESVSGMAVDPGVQPRAARSSTSSTSSNDANRGTNTHAQRSDLALLPRRSSSSA